MSVNKPTYSEPLDAIKTSAFDRRLSIAKASLNIGKRWATNSAFGLFKSKEEKTFKNKPLCVNKHNIW